MKLSKEERKANLFRSSQVYRAQAEQMDTMLNGMSDEEVNNMIDADPDLQNMLSIGADGCGDGIIVNLKEQPNQQHEEIGLEPPWDVNDNNNPNNPPWMFNFAKAAREMNPQQPKRVNLFQVGQNPATGMTYNGFNSPFGYRYNNQNDERFKAYHNGMRMYNINPYNFPTAQVMIDYYDQCEAAREHAENQSYGWALFYARGIGTEEAIEWAEQYKFKPADVLYEERMKAQQKEMEERQRQLTTPDDGNNVIYGVYDCNGVRLERRFHVKLVDHKTGEVVREFGTKYERDALGQHFTRKTQMEDRQEAYEKQKEAQMQAYTARYAQLFNKLFTDAYVNNKNRWQSWRDAGLSEEEVYAKWEDERIDWKREEQKITRALRMGSFSKENFNKILSSVCNTDLSYANRSNFFSLSYDFERDLHYKSLISTPQEMNNDPLVHQKLEEEYEIKRKRFMDKVMSGNLEAMTTTNAYFKPTFGKPKIDDLTLEDFKKPENQFMYTKAVTPDIATENLFIPKDLTSDSPPPIIPEARTIGTMTVDDDTGEILSQQEVDIDITDENIAEYF